MAAEYPGMNRVSIQPSNMFMLKANKQIKFSTNM